MKYVLSIAFLCFLIFSHSSSSVGNNPLYKAIDPEKIMKLREVNVLGVNLTMSVGEILDTLESQGFKMDCRRGGCVGKTDEITIRIQHMRKKFNNRGDNSVNRDGLPVEIGYSQVLGNPQNCASIHQALNLMCSDGVDKHPCRKDSQGGVEAQLGAADKSSDGFIYSGRINVNPQKFCAILMKRLK